MRNFNKYLSLYREVKVYDDDENVSQIYLKLNFFNPFTIFLALGMIVFFTGVEIVVVIINIFTKAFVAPFVWKHIIAEAVVDEDEEITSYSENKSAKKTHKFIIGTEEVSEQVFEECWRQWLLQKNKAEA
jgi:hypothetical protein